MSDCANKVSQSVSHIKPVSYRDGRFG